MQIENGRVKVLKHIPEKLDTQLIFTDITALKNAAVQPPNKLMLALMENRMITQGNLGYLQLVNFLISILLKKIQIQKLLKESKEVDNLFAYAKTYSELGGMQIQFNIVSSAMLRDAMINPENYQNLMVRISGYNAYFVTLNNDMQIELIERAEFGI